MHRLRFFVSWAALWLALLTAAGGCAASKRVSGGDVMAASAAPGGMRYDAEMEMEAAMEEPPAVYAEAKREYREEAMGGGDDFGPAPASPPADAVADVEPEPRPEPEPDETAPSPAHGRQIVYTASMRIGVFKVDEAMAQAELLPEQYGGWVHERRNDYVQMKVPAEHLEAAMAAAAKLGRVEDRQLDANDVTAEFVDLESRLRVLKRTEKQLLELLEKAKTVEETLAVRKALDQVVMELELAKGRMRQLKNMIAFSTFTVYFVEQAPHVITKGQNDPFPWVDSLGVEATEWN